MVATADVVISMEVMITIMLWPVQRVVLVGRRLKVQRGAREGEETIDPGSVFMSEFCKII